MSQYLVYLMVFGYFSEEATQMNVPEDPKAFVSSIENQESVKEAEVVVVSTDINIIEVTTYKHKNSDVPSDQDTLNHQETLSGKVCCLLCNYLFMCNLSIPNLWMVYYPAVLKSMECFSTYA